MKTVDVAQVLRARLDRSGLSTSELAKRAGCTVPEAVQALAGDPKAPAEVLLALCDALGYDLVPRPKPAPGGDAASCEASERAASTSAAQRQVRGPVTFGLLKGNVKAAPDFDAPLPERVQSDLERWEASDQEVESVSRAATEELRREERRLALHEAAVRVLEDHPERVETVLQVLDGWIARGFPNQELAADWRRILESREWGALLERSDRSRRLRKGSPLVSVLDEAERLAIIRRFARCRAGHD